MGGRDGGTCTEGTARICPSCRTRYGAAERFCPRDGAALVPLRADDPLVGCDVGAFRVQRRLAAGGTGRVYLAEQHATGQRVALKVLDPAIAGDPAALQRFQREATNHAALGIHPHVCALIDFGATASGTVFIAMEYVAGEPLAALVQREAPLTPARVAEIVRQAAAGLAAAHAHDLVHRDLKPDNVMLGVAPDGRDHVTLIDFGIARSARDLRQRLTGAGVVVGTPLFMSPEQLTADEVDARSDIYALGLVAFLLLTGALPVPTGTPDAVMRRVLGHHVALHEARPQLRWPAALQMCLDRALAPVPDDRYPRVADFARDLVHAIVGWDERHRHSERAVATPLTVRADAPPPPTVEHPAPREPIHTPLPAGIGIPPRSR